MDRTGVPGPVPTDLDVVAEIPGDGIAEDLTADFEKRHVDRGCETFLVDGPDLVVVDPPRARKPASGVRPNR